MYLWGKDAKYAFIDLYDSGDMAYFTAESYAEPGVPIVIPLYKNDVEDLIRLLGSCLANYEGNDE